MKKLVLILLFAAGQQAFAQNDKAGCDTIEPSYINRIEGFYIQSCEGSEFKDVKFSYYSLSDKYTELTKSGRHRYITYAKKKGETRKVSGSQVTANYTNAVKKIKGECLSSRNNFFHFFSDGKEIFMKVHNAVDSDEMMFNVEIVELTSMHQEIEIDLGEAIKQEGKAAVYGILFDVNKSIIKPGSEKALTQILDYLNKNPQAKVIIVGHTDNTGDYARNMILSKERAMAVKNHLVTIGKISSARLQADGVGSLCPVSTNRTEAGKALNRRVEIVEN